MNVILFGASGMVGQGVLRECLLATDVERVLSVVRAPTGEQHAKLRELVHRDFHDFSNAESTLTELDACFFCLGVTSSGMTEEAYAHVTYDIAVAAAQTLARLNPRMTFVFVSGAGTDSTERGRVMWARVKGRTENAIFRMPFAASFAFRPGLIRPMHGVKSRTLSYRVFYTLAWPIMPLLVRFLPKYVTTTEQIGRAMLGVARHGYPKRILESVDINAVK
ncbi:MAG TPA: NAD-dependent epimerase/dehydratase family protein [Gemmatimonadaceae bacterium]